MQRFLNVFSERRGVPWGDLETLTVKVDEPGGETYKVVWKPDRLVKAMGNLVMLVEVKPVGPDSDE